MAAGKGWWRGKAFTKEGTKREKVEKCSVCRQPLGKCKCRQPKTTPVKVTKKVEVKRGDKTHTRNVQVNAPYRRDTRGIDWCTSCNMRVINGRCTNVTCSTRR